MNCDIITIDSDSNDEPKKSNVEDDIIILDDDDDDEIHVTEPVQTNKTRGVSIDSINKSLSPSQSSSSSALSLSTSLGNFNGMTIDSLNDVSIQEEIVINGTDDNDDIIINNQDDASVNNKNKINLEYGLPSSGPLIRRRVECNCKVLVKKNSSMPWIEAKVNSIISQHPALYRVKYVHKKYNNKLTSVFGNDLALCLVSSVIIPVGTQVVATTDDSTFMEACYFYGVIAEQPKPTNKYRYLIFFDNATLKYVVHKNIYIISENKLNFWEDMPNEIRDFVKIYFEKYPECNMIKLHENQILKTEWNGKWWLSTVLKLDSSLVQIFFNKVGRTEWIYRGSGRFKTLDQNKTVSVLPEKLDTTESDVGATSTITYSSSSSSLSSSSYDYKSVAKKSTSSQQQQQQQQQPQVSTFESTFESIFESTPSSPQKTLPLKRKIPLLKKRSEEFTKTKISHTQQSLSPPRLPSTKKPSHSIVQYKTQNNISPVTFISHKCSSKCIKHIPYTPEDFKGYSMLSIPLLCGWSRQRCKGNNNNIEIIIYQAPCGRRIENIKHLHKYLSKTKSSMSVDLFDFDHFTNCLTEFVIDTCYVNIKDLSYGSENIPVPCVNEIDCIHPESIRYTTKREPTEGVHLNLDTNFLCGCDCEDDCSDKTKCQCWQLTMQGASFDGRVPTNYVGYVYKRLPEPVSTGIYECNANCKCSVNTCLNRVVQHPLKLKLQVFRTLTRGWGIRCLNDVPIGSFICIYAGRLLTEQGANEGGKNYGDEYLAELDYVEVVEAMKADYEGEAIEPLTEDPLSLDDTISNRSPIKKFGTYEYDHEFIIEHYDGPNLNGQTIKKKLRKRKYNHDDVDDDDDDNDIIDLGSSDTDTAEEKECNTPVTSKISNKKSRDKSVLDYYGPNESIYVVDGKTAGNIGRYFNHSCDPNVFVQNVFVDTHDVRFPWVAFFASKFIRAGEELTWNYNYAVNSIPGKSIICRCGAKNCQGRLL
ncbi:hypothetical protein HCN44_004317 [Aphidius gifuensis]|uniref:Histone-lysine N-methyltransferase n=1 Tax=Aphidius gifuensis TaxID=684658 RepID=A0A834XWM4_APHGI|nr:hypothetical protein HCN44_004317 [Aphidius gifuensis]